MTLYEKSLGVLELPAVLAMLSSEAVSAGAKEAAGKLVPSSNILEVESWLKETSAAKKMMELKGGPSFSGVKDVSASLSRAGRGGTLSTRELLDVAAVLRTAREVRAYLGDDREEPTELDALFLALTANRFLEEKITTSILSEEEIADAASRDLMDIRRHMRLAGDKVRQSLQKIISSQSYAKALQEPIITMRNDRYVVPVKAEYKSSVPGLVHDVSSSGATLFIEPMSVVQANNEIRELLAKEKNEIDRILAALSSEAAACAEDITCDYQVLVALDLIFAKAKLSYKFHGTAPELSQEGELILRRARHPLLPVKTAVPIDVRLGGEFDTLVITGPNTGGKTVSLKTIGLLCVMTGCGLHIPVDSGSRIPVYEKVLADIGDEQSIEQSLSTFSAHMTNIINILAECEKGTLLLFDELGAGTDPEEGAALAISIIEYARKMGANVAATTHYGELKIYATTASGVQNASCEFDVETLRPTYKLLIGIPGKSNAFAISARLGLPDFIIDDAKKRIGKETADFEKLLENLEETRQEMEREKTETRKLRIRADEDARSAAEYKKRLEAEKEKAVQLARREADRILEDARAAADDVFDELKQLRRKAAKEGDWQGINAGRSALNRRLNEAEAAVHAQEEKAEEPQGSSRPVKPGDTVILLSVGTEAEVISVSPDRVLTLQAGVLKVTAKESEVRLTEKAARGNGADAGKVRASAEVKLRNLAVKPELDIRGMMTDEAIPVVERFIDSAVLAKLETVTVIHGKGTGALRTAVHQSLRKNKQVKNFRLGRYGEGEMGVTVVTLK